LKRTREEARDQIKRSQSQIEDLRRKLGGVLPIEASEVIYLSICKYCKHHLNLLANILKSFFLKKNYDDYEKPGFFLDNKKTG
jgi:hypothetical protein